MCGVALDSWCTELHAGVFSRVFVAYHPLRPAVVVKVYSKRRLQQRLYTNIRREIAALHALHRVPSVVRLLQATEDADNIYLVFEPCEGGDLFKRLQRRLLSEDEVRQQVVAPLLGVLATMHGAGIIHRDIKPENVFFDANGGLRLGDFGLAVPTWDAGSDGTPNDLRCESPRTRLGTPEYMAPEVHCRPRAEELAFMGMTAADLPPYTSSVDIWAVGVLMYECLCGSDALSGGEGIKVAGVVVPHAQAAMLLPGVSFECRQFMAAALEQDPSLRPTASQLLRHPWLLKHRADAALQRLTRTCSELSSSSSCCLALSGSFSAAVEAACSAPAAGHPPCAPRPSLVEPPRPSAASKCMPPRSPLGGAAARGFLSPGAPPSRMSSSGSCLDTPTARALLLEPCATAAHCAHHLAATSGSEAGQLGVAGANCSAQPPAMHSCSSSSSSAVARCLEGPLAASAPQAPAGTAAVRSVPVDVPQALQVPAASPFAAVAGAQLAGDDRRRPLYSKVRGWLRRSSVSFSDLSCGSPSASGSFTLGWLPSGLLGSPKRK